MTTNAEQMLFFLVVGIVVSEAIGDRYADGYEDENGLAVPTRADTQLRLRTLPTTPSNAAASTTLFRGLSKQNTHHGSGQ